PRPRGPYHHAALSFPPTPPLGTTPTITTVDSPPLHALRNTGGVVNGVFTYAGSTTFPASSTHATNYWVDPVFTPQSFTTPPGPAGNLNATPALPSAPLARAA